MRYKLILTNKETGEQIIKDGCIGIQGVQNSKTELVYGVDCKPGIGFGIIDLIKYTVSLDSYY